jgi:hypothetical protein
MGQTLLAAFWLTRHAGAAGLSRLFPGGRPCQSPGLGGGVGGADFSAVAV